MYNLVQISPYQEQGLTAKLLPRGLITYHATCDEEPDHYRHCLSQVRCVCTFNPVLIKHLSSEVLLTYRQVENGSYTNWPEETHDPSLSPLFRLVDAFVQKKYDRWSS